MSEVDAEYEGKTALVTGGAGAIGTNLSRRLSAMGAKKVIILDDLSSAYEWNIPRATNIAFIKGNVLDDETLKRVFKERPEYVFHLAAHLKEVDGVPLSLTIGAAKNNPFKKSVDGKLFFGKRNLY